MARRTRSTRLASFAAMLVVLTSGGCSDEPDVREVETRMQEEMHTLLTELVPDAEVEEERQPEGRIPCGGLEGASWSKVLTSYDASVPDPPAPGTLLPRAQDALDDLGIDYVGGNGWTLLTIKGKGYGGTLRLDDRTGLLLVSVETDCLKNPDE